MRFTIHAPTILETRLTGNIGAASRDYRGALWRADYKAGAPVTLSRNGAAVPWEAAPAHARQLAREGLELFERLNAMESGS